VDSRARPDGAATFDDSIRTAGSARPRLESSFCGPSRDGVGASILSVQSELTYARSLDAGGNLGTKLGMFHFGSSAVNDIAIALDNLRTKNTVRALSQFVRSSVIVSVTALAKSENTGNSAKPSEKPKSV
jgi:hypothetical protein